MHGHDYSVKLRMKYHSEIIDQFFDFRVVNSWVNQIINELNHKILLPERSPGIKIQPIRNGENWLILLQGKEYSFPQKDVKILKGIEQTTCEHLAEYIHKFISSKMKETGKYEMISDLTIILSETVGNEVSYSSKII